MCWVIVLGDRSSGIKKPDSNTAAAHATPQARPDLHGNGARTAAGAMDHAGALIIGAALSLLFMRVVGAIAHKQRITAAMQQHHTPKQPARSASDSFRELFQALERALVAVPMRLRIGLGLGGLYFMISLVTAAAPVLLRDYLPEMLMEGAGGRALWLAAKWMCLGAAIQGARRWVVQHVAALRRQQ